MPTNHDLSSLLASIACVRFTSASGIWDRAIGVFADLDFLGRTECSVTPLDIVSRSVSCVRTAGVIIIGVCHTVGLIRLGQPTLKI